MFERFTHEARQVVASAQEEARRLHHNYIGTEHLLLGCFCNTELGAGAALTAVGLDVDRVREDVRQLVGMGEDPRSGQIPFTPRAKKVMELSVRDAQSLGHAHIESLHLLLGLAGEKDGVAMRVLRGSGISSDRIRETALAMLPAGETVDGVQRATPAHGRRSVTLSSGSGAAFTVAADPALRRLLMAAAGRALSDGREAFGVEDLLAVIDRKPPDSQAASF
jgi:ATP-dependent Clp protease ATP-binding subunit ClpC